MKEQLEDKLLADYKVYLDYSNFVDSISDSILKDRQNFSDFALKMGEENMEALIEKAFEINEKPFQYRNDLIILETRLLNTFDVVKDLIEVPQEIKDKVLSMKRVSPQYKIEENKLVEIDPESNKKYREEVAKNYKAFLSDMFKAK